MDESNFPPSRYDRPHPRDVAEDSLQPTRRYHHPDPVLACRVCGRDLIEHPPMSVESSLCRSCEDIAKCLVPGPQQYGNMALSGVRLTVGFALMAPILPIFSVIWISDGMVWLAKRIGLCVNFFWHTVHHLNGVWKLGRDERIRAAALPLPLSGVGE